MIEAKVVLKCAGEDEAESVFEAVSPDDFEAPRFTVKTSRSRREVIVEVRCRKLGSLIETLDDLLSCVQIAERTIKILK
ncbi:hypothetical protein J7L06_08665 [Candidatus Bathyarchaeota archaeon]|nr:hypothetical protein [Candidatus Bathyarchaeota archaeon]